MKKNIILIVPAVALIALLGTGGASHQTEGSRAQRIAEDLGVMNRRTADYDYDVPTPGSYELPALGMAADGTVVATDGKPIGLHKLMRDRIVVLSFVYTRCADPKACLRASGVLKEIQKMSRHYPELKAKLLLLTLSFDPSFDTPEVMARYGRVYDDSEGADWLFLTTRSQKDLKPLLDAYGQRVDKRESPSPFGPYNHVLRVYLIDPGKEIRNIYSLGLLDPRLVMTDVLTLAKQQRSVETKDKAILIAE